MDKNLAYYLNLPYTRELFRDPGGWWFVRVKELPGCASQGDTPEEAMRMIEDAMTGWLELALEDGDPIPEPRPEEEFSGKFVVRVPKSLHRLLVEAADLDEVSLNQYINTVLALHINFGASKPAAAPPLAEPAGQELATWLKQKFQTITFAHAAGQVDEVQSLMANLLEELSQRRGSSPLAEAVTYMVDFLQETLQSFYQTQQHEQEVQQKISELINAVNSPTRQEITVVQRQGYSNITTGPESSLADELFASFVHAKEAGK